MEKPILTLLSQSLLLDPSSSKVIKKEDYSRILSAKELVALVTKEAEKFREEQALEAEKSKEQGYLDGFVEGLSLFSKKIEVLEGEILRAKEVLSKESLPVALKAAKKILGESIRLDPEIFLDAIKQHFKAVKAHKKITLWVSKEDYPTTEQAKESLKMDFEALESFSIRPKEDLSKGNCLIETEGGIINGNVDHVWNILEKAFIKILGKKS